MINISGNYGNLGLLTVVACLPFLQDDFTFPFSNFAQVMPNTFSDSVDLFYLPLHLPFFAILVFYVIASAFPTNSTACETFFQEVPPIFSVCYEFASRWSLVNRYGPFGAMHDYRHEIRIFGLFKQPSEGESRGGSSSRASSSKDATSVWREYSFYYKPYHPDIYPPYVSFWQCFHWPRFDWFLWFIPLRASRTHRAQGFWPKGDLDKRPDLQRLKQNFHRNH